MKNGRFQAKDIDDVFFLRCVDWASMEPRPPLPWKPQHDSAWELFPHWVFIWHLECLMPIFPSEVIHAKARRLMARGLLTGCDCGCRGDFELTAKGVEMIFRSGHEIIQSGWTLEVTVAIQEATVH